MTGKHQCLICDPQPHYTLPSWLYWVRHSWLRSLRLVVYGEPDFEEKKILWIQSIFFCFLKIDHTTEFEDIHLAWRLKRGCQPFEKTKYIFLFLFLLERWGWRSCTDSCSWLPTAKLPQTCRSSCGGGGQDGARRWEVGLCLALPRGAIVVSLGKVEIWGRSPGQPPHPQYTCTYDPHHTPPC